MSTPIEVKLYAAASQNPGLIAQLGSSPFRWYNVQLTEGSAYPAIVVLRVSGPPLYAMSNRVTTTRYRMQFTIWEGYTPDDTDAVFGALRSFLDTFSATGIAANFAEIVNVKRGIFTDTQPGVFQTIVDAMIYNNDSL